MCVIEIKISVDYFNKFSPHYEPVWFPRYPVINPLVLILV